MNKVRFEAFSDGVFAIVITLLAIELHPFHVIEISDFYNFLPKLLLFLLSFGTIAVFWINHHHLSHKIENISSKILWVNILALMFVTLIPFATSLLGENALTDLALAFYALIMLCASASFYMLRRIVHDISERSNVYRSMAGPICYVAALIFAFIHPMLSYIFILLPPIYFVLPHAYKDKK